MNIHAINKKSTRLAMLAFFTFFCSQAVRASDINPMWPKAGAALSLLSGVVRYARPPISPLGMFLDATCVGTNVYAASGYKPNVLTDVADLGCLFALALQYTRLVPTLTLGVSDPLFPVRAGISLANGLIIACRLFKNFNNYKQN